jgi:putative membrane protein
MRHHFILKGTLVTMVLLVLYALFSPWAHAQLGNPGFMKPGSAEAKPGMPAPTEANTDDRLFVLLVGAGGLAEVEAAKLANDRSRDPHVKAFAQQMAHDHSGANDELARIARDSGLPMPTAPDPDHQAQKRELESLAPAQFDIAYLRAQVVDHQKTSTLLEWEIAQGQNANLQQYAKATLPVVTHHLQEVQALVAERTGAAPQGLAGGTAVARATH